MDDSTAGKSFSHILLHTCVLVNIITAANSVLIFSRNMIK